jgi:hypothetical protein
MCNTRKLGGMTTSQPTPGQQLTTALRRYLGVGTRTRRYRKGDDLHREMYQALRLAAEVAGYFTERTESALRPGYAAALSYEKHVMCFRVGHVLRRRIEEMSPWQFAALLGRMVDAGVTCTGAGERFFAEMSKEATR